jgi:hypothetical protein
MGTRMLLTSFSLRWFIIRLFYKAEPATEFFMARGRTEMDIKRVAMANMKVFSQAGIRIIPERNSPVQTDPFKHDKDKTPSSWGCFHTHRRYQENSR